MQANLQESGPGKTWAYNLKPFQAQFLFAVGLGIGWCCSLSAAAGDSVDPAPAKASHAIPWSQIGAKAGADYQGDELAVEAAVELGPDEAVQDEPDGEAGDQQGHGDEAEGGQEQAPLQGAEMEEPDGLRGRTGPVGRRGLGRRSVPNRAGVPGRRLRRGHAGSPGSRR